MRYKRLRKEENYYNANVVEKQCFSGENDVSLCFWGRVVAGSNPVTPTTENQPLAKICRWLISFTGTQMEHKIFFIFDFLFMC